jgi:hypothetical protein
MLTDFGIVIEFGKGSTQTDKADFILSRVLNLTAFNFQFFWKANLLLEYEHKAIINRPVECYTINRLESSVYGEDRQPGSLH